MNSWCVLKVTEGSSYAEAANTFSLVFRLSFVVNPFLANAPILYPVKTLENLVFLVFSGGIKGEHLPEMG